MFTRNLLKKALLPVIVSAGLLSIPAFATPQENDKTNTLMKSAGHRSAEALKNVEESKLILEAIQSVNLTQHALALLVNGKVDEAKKLLKEARSKLYKLSVKYKGKLDRLPINVVITEIDGVDNILTAKNIIEKAKKACERNDIPSARDLLEALRNEIHIQTSYLPLDIFKKSVILASDLLEKGKVEDAIKTLNIALSSIEIEDTIIPKPLAEAIVLIDDARKIFNHNPQDAKRLLEEAKRRIRLAQVLGYVRTKDEIAPLIAEINKLEKSITSSSAKSEHFQTLIKHVKSMQKKATHTQEKK